MALDLCTLNDVKQFLEGMSNTDDYNYALNLLIKSISKRFEQWAGRVWDNNNAADITEYFDGGKETAVIVKHIPIASITGIYDDTDRLYTAGTLIAATYYTYYAERGKIQLTSGTFEDGFNNVKVVYRGGYTAATIPDDLKMACVAQVAHEFRNREKTGLTSQTAQGGTVNFFQPLKFLPSVEQVLWNYKAGILP